MSSETPSRTQAGGPAATKEPDVPYADFTTANGDTVSLRIEIASTPDERAKGLMFRESLPQDQGMLFDFQGDTQSSFWMKNTLIPLSIAFIEADGAVLHIEDMAPQTEELHNSPSPYRYAIEVNEGWFKDNGIREGDRVQIRPG